MDIVLRETICGLANGSIRQFKCWRYGGSDDRLMLRSDCPLGCNDRTKHAQSETQTRKKPSKKSRIAANPKHGLLTLFFSSPPKNNARYRSVSTHKFLGNSVRVNSQEDTFYFAPEEEKRRTHAPR